MRKTKRNWKSVRATHLLGAFELCLDYALAEHNRSVARIAHLMGQPNTAALYKWLGNGRMPANLIPVFEHACGCHFVSEWLALSTGQMVIAMPRAKKVTAKDINGMQGLFSHATGLLIDFYNGNAGQDETVGALTAVLAEVAGQRANVVQASAPELGFFEGDGDE